MSYSASLRDLALSDFATLCLQSSDGSLHLAFAHCWRDGMLWRSDSNRWQQLTAWPSMEEIRAFEVEHADVVEPALKSGFLPHPPGTEEFHLTHAAIRMSEGNHEVQANKNIDPVVFAAALRNGIVPGSFSFAEFHEPRWHSAKDGVQAIEKSIEHLQLMLNQPECEAMDCDAFMKLLHALKERLHSAEQLDVKFYFLGMDRSTE